LGARAAAWLGCDVTAPRILFLALALGLHGPAVTAAPRTPTQATTDATFQTTTRVADGIWVLAQPDFVVQPAGNVTIVEQSDGVVLIDAGGSPGAARRVVASIRALTSKPVKAVVITHWHGDHPQGLSEILQAWPQARTIATRATQAHLRDPKTMNTPASPDAVADAAFQKRVQGFVAYCEEMASRASDERERIGWVRSAALFRHYATDMAGAVTLAPAEAFEDTLALPDPVRPVELRFLGRANTDGDAVAWLPRQRVLVTGDIVVAPIPFGFGSYPEDWLAVLRRLEAYDFAILVPGHGPPQRDRSYLRSLAAAISEVRAQVSRLASAGASLDEVRQRLDLTAQSERFAGDDPWLRRWFDEYWVKPVTASAYREATGQPIVQSLSAS
jgi:glyoxylase-like metal-dependent hydrolase (beta-lactamase superfamily II)